MENLQFAGKFYILISDIAHDSHIVEHIVKHCEAYTSLLGSYLGRNQSHSRITNKRGNVWADD